MQTFVLFKHKIVLTLVRYLITFAASYTYIF